MTKAELVSLDRSRTALTGIALPEPPPTRVYISGRLYRLVPSPQVALPPIVNVAKVVLKWLLAGGRVANNILHVKATGWATSDPTQLTALSNGILTAISLVPKLTSSVASSVYLQSITCYDLGGTSAQGSFAFTQIPGGSVADSLPPQVAAVLSWQIAETYRGGKPRTYIPGVPASAVTPAGGSALSSTYASALESQGTSFMSTVNSLAIGSGGTCQLGAVSYHTAHTIRPTPLFRQFINVRVHERVDSQRRRSGPESSFGVIP